MKLFSGKTTQSLKLKLLKSKLVIAGILGNSFEATSRSKTNVLSIPKWHFSFFFSNFFIDEIETIDKGRQKVENCVNPKLVIGSILENRIGSTLMLWALENGVFQVFENFWVTGLKQFSGKATESGQNCSKGVQSAHFRKWFWSSLEVKNECSSIF